jgi:hypothetical protein
VPINGTGCDKFYFLLIILVHIYFFKFSLTHMAGAIFLIFLVESANLRIKSVHLNN